MKEPPHLPETAPEPELPGSLRPQELSAVYAISQVIAQPLDTHVILDKIIALARPVFIFDSLILFEMSAETQTLEATFARVIGRGRSKEADLAWGEHCAQQAYQSNQTTFMVESVNQERDRTDIRHSLAIPLKLWEETRGVLVFIRFGGPPYAPDQIHLAEFIAVHIAQLLERRQMVERIASLEARRRLDSLQSEFIAMISHELLTPLGFIKGYATTLLRQDISWDEETRREFLQIIDEEADHLRALINDLMDSSSLQAGTLQMNFHPVRLATLIREAVQRALDMHPQLQVTLLISDSELYVNADPARLAQVLNNILSNAVKYAPGSPIQILVERQEEEVHLAIRDWGPGIAPEHLPYIFQRFYRIPEQSGTVRGTGLGLYICRQIIEAHQGKIEVESTPGEGATFHIYLPLCQPATA